MMEENPMIQPNPAGTTTPIPPCARLAAFCAAINGRAITCPAAIQRKCATLATLRPDRPARREVPRELSGAGASGATN